MRTRILSEQWLRSEHSLPVSLLDPFLDRISDTLAKRAAEALESLALRLSYADTLRYRRMQIL